MPELFPFDDDNIGPQFSSKHGDDVFVAYCDGHTQAFPLSKYRSGEGRKYLFGFVTIGEGRPYKGKWLPGEQPSDLAEFFPPEIGAENLSSTDVIGHLHGRTTPARNMVWCATVQIAWDELRQKIGAVPQVPNSELADGLGKTPFPHTALDPASHMSKMGTIGDGIKQKIADEMTRRFPDVKPPSISAEDPTDVIIYGFLQKNLPFAKRFDRLHEPLAFHAPGGDVNVKSFGFKKLKEAKNGADMLKKQVHVLSYRSDDDFVIRLSSKSDEIVLAKVELAATLSETVAAVKKRIAAGEEARPTIEDDETLIVPNLAFNVLRDFYELKNKVVTNFKRGEVPYSIREAKQSVRFLLNESGARIESGIKIHFYLNGHGAPPPPPKPRRFVLDRPFLLLVKETKADEPYLVMWVANDEIMQKFQAR